MLERTSRFHFDDILAGNFVFDQDNSYSSLENKRGVRKRLCANSASKPHEVSQLSNDHIMTRKTRTRTPRIPTIQSGYCAVCNLPYNNVEEHIQSKKHQKLIGEDANYIALNGSLNGFLHTNSIPFLNLNGIDAIGKSSVFPIANYVPLKIVLFGKHYLIRFFRPVSQTIAFDIQTILNGI